MSETVKTISLVPGAGSVIVEANVLHPVKKISVCFYGQLTNANEDVVTEPILISFDNVLPIGSISLFLNSCDCTGANNIVYRQTLSEKNRITFEIPESAISNFKMTPTWGVLLYGLIYAEWRFSS